MADIVIGIMGPGSNPTDQDLKNAYALGQYSASKNYVTLTGGSKAGVMNEALKGAKDAYGRTIGILAFADKSMASEYADIVIVTAMGSARNNINVLSCDVLVACGLEAGTLSEVAMTLKASKKVVLLNQNAKGTDFLKELGKDNILVANSPEQAIEHIEAILKV